MISYGNDTADAYRRAGLYAGRILKGAKPADLPIDRATKFELITSMSRPQEPSNSRFPPRRRGD
jgi:putative tryptophan/tyrosine transport system substrate-binding protein